MECWKSAYLPWKTVTLKSRSMVCCLSTEDNLSHFLQWNDNSWTLLGTDYEFHFPFESWRTRLLVSARWGYGAHSKFNNADAKRVLWWSHYFSKLVAPSITGSVATGFISRGGGGGLKENVYETNAQTLELKQNSELCISNVTAETLHRVASNMRKRVNACIAERGGHFQHLKQHCLLFFLFQCNFFYKYTCQEWVAWLFDGPVQFRVEIRTQYTTVPTSLFLNTTSRPCLASVTVILTLCYFGR
jgi:hypothetical protein